MQQSFILSYTISIDAKEKQNKDKNLEGPNYFIHVKLVHMYFPSQNFI